MLEVACFNASSAIAAAKAGADRIELCANYTVGGITPSLATLYTIRPLISIPINVMIRPRAGDFMYSNGEFEKMRVEIEMFKPVVDGFVFGILDSEKCVDVTRNTELVELAKPLPCTFHRAFDEVSELVDAAVQVVKCGFAAVLTSGGRANASLGADVVARLEARFRDQVVFILGGGVRSTNVEELRLETSVKWFHSAAITGQGEEVDEKEVRQIQKLLNA